MIEQHRLDYFTSRGIHTGYEGEGKPPSTEFDCADAVVHELAHLVSTPKPAAINSDELSQIIHGYPMEVADRLECWAWVIEYQVLRHYGFKLTLSQAADMAIASCSPKTASSSYKKRLRQLMRRWNLTRHARDAAHEVIYMIERTFVTDGVYCPQRVLEGK